MKIAVVLLGLLLVTLSHSENNCRQNIEETFFYFIYNTSVEINAYYCSYSIEDDFQCEHSDSGKIQTNSPYLLQQCKSHFFGQLSKPHNNQNTSAKLCEMRARVNLLEDIVTLSDKKSCSYSGKKCYDDNNSKFVFWSSNDICKSISAIHWNTFTPFNNKYDRTMFIKDTDISLILKENLQFCDVEVWKTNHDNIIVSPKLFSRIDEKKAELSKLRSNFEEFCDGKIDNQQSSTDSKNVNDVTKIWYIYTYPKEVTIHICLMNGKKSCEDLNLGETVSKNNLNCNSIKLAYKGYERMCGHRKCVIPDDTSTKLILSQQGLLCGETVWYANQNGLVASERELKFTPSKTFSLKNTVLPSENLSSSQLHPVLDQLKSVKVEEYFIISFLTVCLLWIGFKIVMCLIYLCTKCTTKKKVPTASEGVELRRVRTEVHLPQN